MKRVTQDDILKINQIYFETKNYAETARKTGWSASTVKKYVNLNFVPIVNDNIKNLNIEIKNIDLTIEEIREKLILSEKDKAEIKELQKEILL